MFAKSVAPFQVTDNESAQGVKLQYVYNTVIVSQDHVQMGAEDHLTTVVCFGYCVYDKGLEQ